MNANDPILTAYALDELEPHERAQIEQLLHENPTAAAEAERTRGLARMLGTTLANEPAGTLTPAHRAEILKAAGLNGEPAPKRNIVDGPNWWRTWEFGATAAACMVFGFGAYAIFDALTERRPKFATSTQTPQERMMIGVPGDDADSRAQREPNGANDAPAEVAVGAPSAAGNTNAASPVGKLTVFSPTVEPRVELPVPDPGASAGTNPATVQIGAPVAIEKTPKGIKRNPGKPIPASGPYASAISGGLLNPQATGNSVSVSSAGVFQETARHPVSSFPIAIGTSSYAEISASLRKNQLPRPENVRIDELLNFFSFDYHQPSTGKPLTLDLEAGPCPWNAAHRLLRIGIRTRVGGTREIVAEQIGTSVEFNRTLVASYRLVGYEGQGNSTAGPTRRSLISGETATALYEFVPATAMFKTTDDFATVSLNYTQPGSGAERTIQTGTRDTGKSWSDCDDDFRWAASVATFGMLLRSSSVDEPENWKRLGELFRSSSSGAPRSDRTVFLNFVTKASTIATSRRGR